MIDGVGQDRLRKARELAHVCCISSCVSVVSVCLSITMFVVAVRVVMFCCFTLENKNNKQTIYCGFFTRELAKTTDSNGSPLLYHHLLFSELNHIICYCHHYHCSFV